MNLSFFICSNHSNQIFKKLSRPLFIVFMQRNWILPGKISQVDVGGVFGEDYLRIDASHTLEVARARGGN